jgi:hypothetical protein
MWTWSPRNQLAFAGVLAGIFAIPAVTLVSCMVVFPIAFYAVIAAIANFTPIFLLFASCLRRWNFAFVDIPTLWQKWLFFAIIWSGCAYGFSHWGDVASTMGARNYPYLDIWFAPFLWPLGFFSQS